MAGAISEYPDRFVGGIQQGLSIYDALANRGAQQRAALMQEQMGALQLKNAIDERNYQSEMRPLELDRARQQQQDAAIARRARLIGAMQAYGSGQDVNPVLQQHFNEALQQEFGPHIDHDGSGKTFAGLHPAPDGSGHVMLVNAPQPDGSTAVKPVTEKRSADPNDPVLVFSNDFFLKTGDEALKDLATRLNVSLDDAKKLVDSHNRRAQAALTALSGGKTEDEWSDPYALGDSYVQKNLRTGEVRQAATNWRGEAIKARGGAGGKGPTRIMQEAMERQRLYGGDLGKHFADVAEQYYGHAASNRNRAGMVALTQRVQSGEFLNDDGTFDMQKFNAAADTVFPDAKPATGKDAGKGASKPAAQHSQAYQEYLDAFNATNDPQKRAAITARARQLGVVR